MIKEMGQRRGPTSSISEGEPVSGRGRSPAGAERVRHPDPTVPRVKDGNLIWDFCRQVVGRRLSGDQAEVKFATPGAVRGSIPGIIRHNHGGTRWGWVYIAATIAPGRWGWWESVKVTKGEVPVEGIITTWRRPQR